MNRHKNNLNPIGLEVLRGKLTAVADEMEFVLLKSSYSSIVTEALDATCALFDVQGRTIAQACAIPVHLGVLCELGQRFASRYPADEAEDGDIYIVNDPYSGGTHLPDIAVATPVFCDSNLVGYVASMVHHQDLGGSAPGSTSANAYDHLAEGLRIPLIRLARAGNWDQNKLNIMAANSRSPTNFLGDLSAQVAACRTGERRLQKIFEDGGLEDVNGGLSALMNYAERLTRVAIANIPDGKYSFVDWLDDDGLSPNTAPVKIAVTIVVHGSEIEFDFTGTDNQVKAAINSVRSSTIAVVYYAVRVLTGDDAPNNDGCYRPISIKLPPGSITNAEFPAPVNARMITVHRIGDVVLGALAQAVPQKIAAAGCGQTSVLPVGGINMDTGKSFVGILGGPYRGGMGARFNKDGIDVTDHDICNVYHVPIEVNEAELPVRYRSLQLWCDSGGAGTWRGGLGYHADLEWLGSDASVSLRRERYKIGPWGLHGGLSAPTCRSTLVRVDGSVSDLPGKMLAPIQQGDRLNYWTTGGGGNGPPIGRDPNSVLSDVLDGKVSETAALEIYRVALENNEIQWQETKLLRDTVD